MKLWQIFMIVISIAIVIYIWYPKWFGKEERTIEMKMFRKVPRSEMETLDIPKGLPETVPLKEKRDLKITITWIVATLNGLMLLVTQIKKIIK